MVAEKVPPAEAPEPENPLLAEASALNEADNEIVAEIARLDAAEGETETVAPTPSAEVRAVPSETTPTSAVAAKPPEVPATPTPPVVTSPIAPDVQDYIKRLEDINRKAQQEAETRILQDTIAQYAARLEQEQGLNPEQATAIANREGNLIYQQYQTEQFRQGQINAALAIAQEHSVDPRSLMNLPSPEAMREMAKSITTQRTTETRLAALEQENKQLKQGRVPPQTMDNNRGVPIASSDENALLDQYNRGVRTPQTLAAARRAAGM